MKKHVLGLVAVFLLVMPIAIDTSSVRCESCNVVLVSVEPLRADHMTVYGYERNTTPELEGFSEDAFVFDRAFTQSHHTTVALFSTFSSLYPSQHGVGTGNARERGFSREFMMLAEVLDSSGYFTAAATGGGNVRGELGFRRGFDRYRDRYYSDRFLRSTIKESGDRPFFFFYQSFPTHGPFLSEGGTSTNNASESYVRLVEKFREDQQKAWNRSNESWPEFNRRVKEIKRNYYSALEQNQSLRKEAIAEYDDSIREGDRDFGQVIDVLESEDELDNTVVIFVSQHGEEFNDHGRWQHESLFNEVMRVPLIVRIPGEEGGRINEPVELIDLAPTLTNVLSVEHEGFERQSEGVSLSPVFRGGSVDKQSVFAESSTAAAFIDVSSGLKYISAKKRSGDYTRVFNISSDFEEENEVESSSKISAVGEIYERFQGGLERETAGNVFPYYAR